MAILRLAALAAVLASFATVGCASETAQTVEKRGKVASRVVVDGEVDFGALPAGSFAVELENTTHGQYADNQIFISIVGVDDKAPLGHVTYAMPTGSMVKNAPEGEGLLMEVKRGHREDNDAPGCLQKSGRCWANYSFTLADLGGAKTIYLPGDGKYYGTRIYVSLGEPIYQEVSVDERGLSQLNLQDPNDPNFDVPQDWFEFTYDPMAQPHPIPLGGNVTQVDLYSIPMAFDVKGVNGTKMTRGITMGASGTAGVETQAELVAKYQAKVSEPFKNLVQTDKNGKIVRFIAPYHGKNFQAGGADEHYFDAYVDEVWAQFASQPETLSFNDQPNGHGNRFTGCAPDADHEGQICFMYASADGRFETGPWYMAKPTTFDVLQNGGALQPGCRSSEDLNECNAFGAQLAGALNRGVAKTPADWLDASKFYKNEGPKNDWAEFWHGVSIDNRAYGMGFDDTGDQSSVAILPTTENAAKVRIGIGW